MLTIAPGATDRSFAVFLCATSPTSARSSAFVLSDPVGCAPKVTVVDDADVEFKNSGITRLFASPRKIIADTWLAFVHVPLVSDADVATLYAAIR